MDLLYANTIPRDGIGAARHGGLAGTTPRGGHWIYYMPFPSLGMVLEPGPARLLVLERRPATYAGYTGLHPDYTQITPN